MSTSVIVSTYNQPKWLELTLLGYSIQIEKDFEIIVADDGSTLETANVIDRIRAETGLSIIHVWHEDEGFRKCRALNAAIRASDLDYLILTDGDCIPAPDFTATHMRLKEPGRFLSGGYVKLTNEVSQQITREEVLNDRVTRASWPISKGMPRSSSLMKLTRIPWLNRLMDVVTTTKATWNGHNASGYRKDIVNVNGFDERMKYGGEDRELGERLENAGIRGKRIRYRAACIHLDHARGYVRKNDLERNMKIRQQTRSTRSTWTEHGIKQ